MPKSKDRKNKKQKMVYLDYASATPLDREVAKSMTAVSSKFFSNPSSIHRAGVKTKAKLEEARSRVAKILEADSTEIIFTSGATEANNLAILGVIAKSTELFLEKHTYSPAGELLCSARPPAQGFSKNIQLILPHIVTTNIEHASVLEVCKYLENRKLAEVTYVNVEPSGIVDPKKIKKALKKNTALVSVMYANNEIGTVEPIREVAKEIRHFNKNNNTKILLHSDATQAMNYLPINILKLGIDLMSFNAGKIYGPKGVGVLFKKRGVELESIVHGGEQEFGIRPGTENIVDCVGLATALEITEKIKKKEISRLTKLQDYFLKKLHSLSTRKEIEIMINGDLKQRLPNNINITIPKIPSDLLVLELGARGIMTSSKSACKAGDGKGSHVLQAIRPTTNDIDGSLRFSLGRDTTKTDIDQTLSALSSIIEKLKKWYY